MFSTVMSSIHCVILISSHSISSPRLLFYLTHVICHFTQLFQFAVSLGLCVLFIVLTVSSSIYAVQQDAKFLND